MAGGLRPNQLAINVGSGATDVNFGGNSLSQFQSATPWNNDPELYIYGQRTLVIIYPDKPWTDGQTFDFILSNGTYIVGTYNEPKNAWSMQRVLPEQLNNQRPPIFSDNEPTVYPDPNLPDNSLIAGDVWYDTSDEAGAIKYVWDGEAWIKDASDGFQTTATLPCYSTYDLLKRLGCCTL